MRVSRRRTAGLLAAVVLTTGVAYGTSAVDGASDDVAAGSEKPCHDAEAALTKLYHEIGTWQAQHLGEPMHRAEVPGPMRSAEQALRAGAASAKGTAIEPAFRYVTDSWDQYQGSVSRGDTVDDPTRVAAYIGLIKSQDDLLGGCKELGIAVTLPSHTVVG